MAQTQVEVIFKWENNKKIEVEAKEGSNTITVLRVDENGHLAEMMPAVLDLVERYIKALLTRVAKDMAQP